jgi:hypothetical protein
MKPINPSRRKDLHRLASVQNSSSTKGNAFVAQPFLKEEVELRIKRQQGYLPLIRSSF